MAKNNFNNPSMPNGMSNRAGFNPPYAHLDENKVENFCKASCSGTFKLSNEHDRTGFNVGFESGPDLYNFILEQATIGYEVDREIGKFNIFSQKYIKHTIRYTAKGIVID